VEARGRHVLRRALRRQRSSEPGEPAHRDHRAHPSGRGIAHEGQRRDQQGRWCARRRQPCACRGDRVRPTGEAEWQQPLNRSRAAPRAPPPVAPAALLHGALWAALLGVAALVPAALATSTPWSWIEGPLAALLGWVARLPLWWVPINVAFFPLLFAALGLKL